MIVNNELKLTSQCWFDSTKIVDDDNVLTSQDVCLNYVENSSDPWYSDNETYIDINKEVAKEIIQFLSDQFGLAVSFNK